MKRLKMRDGRSRLFIMVFLLLTTPLIMAPDADPCPACLVIEGFYTALNAGDVDRAMSYVAEDAVLWRLDNVAYRGEDEIRKQLKRETATFSYQVDDIVAEGKGVSYVWKMVSDREVWAGTDTAIVQEGQILDSRLEVEDSGN